MEAEYGHGVGLSVGAEVDTSASKFSNGNAAGWARNWVLIAAAFILFVALAGRGRG